MDSSASSLEASPSSQLPSPKPLARSEPSNPYPTTFVQADTSSFKQVVQMLTGSPSPNPDTSNPHSTGSPAVPFRLHSIPPVKPCTTKRTCSGSSGFKLYERRNPLKNLKINPLQPLSAFSGLKSEILSPSILDFPALVLSPVTPLTHDPFTRSPTILGPNGLVGSPDERGGGSVSPSRVVSQAEEREIREKGFFFHPSLSTTPRDTEPTLLPLFPVISPGVSGN